MDDSSKEPIDRKLETPVLVAMMLMVFVFGMSAFVVHQHPPKPRNVPGTATLVSRGFMHYWQECWFDQELEQDHCRIYSGGGDRLRDGAFLDMDHGSTVQRDALEIVQGGNADSIHLKNGTILLPQENFYTIRKQIRAEPTPDH